MASGEHGASLIELLVVVAIMAAVAAIGAPVAASVADASRVRHAAAFVSSRFRLAKQDAVSHGVNVGVVFDRVGPGWSVRVCRDGNRNGIRRTDITSGVDPCIDGPVALGDVVPHVDIAVDATLRGPAGEAPSPDPVRFGSSNIASFSPEGSCTSGSLFLRSSGGAQFTVRIAGITGRIRVMRYESPSAGWKDE
ncbi:MAG TPA: prepilin-type N-terminal cleavage/methylation domain-containing protein [Vicinamibacterales bacterium]|nr:prepilin-type N-terminal cleavage/methylation domain-containing protein [Vicinamibacterales bacterium]